MRAFVKVRFVCPTCGRVSEQNNTVVRKDTYMLCLNTAEHNNRKTRIMKVEKGG